MAKPNIYTPAGRQRLANRLVASMSQPSPETVTSGLQVKFYNGEPLGTGNPYGYLPFMLKASPEELTRAIEFCGKKKEQYAETGDVFRAWLYGSRQSLMAGLLTHFVTMGIV